MPMYAILGATSQVILSTLLQGLEIIIHVLVRSRQKLWARMHQFQLSKM